MSDLRLRAATRADVASIVALLSDDPLGRARENLDDLGPYLTAFDRIEADPNQHQVVAERDGEVVGTLQLSIAPGLSRQGASRATIEGVRVAAGARGDGLGTQLIEWAAQESRRLGASLVQLTSDASRVEARRLYERLGFTASHVGFKKTLD